MKKSIGLFLIGISLLVASCKDRSDYSTQWSSDGKDSIVNVHYVDNSGNSQNFFMNYIIFRTLFNSGGYGNVYNYYHNHTDYYPSTKYQSYRSNYSPSYRSSTSSGYSSPNRSIFSSGSKSSYSSPSRSYSSPSRSYSSPSRSYSSPSRSYSSPSRH